jgi:Xaa-Pro aminopeptidase
MMHKYTPISNDLYKANRYRFSKQLSNKSVAIFHSNDQFPRNGDLYHHWRQNSDMYYLSGIDQEKSILVLFPNAPLPQYREALFILESNEQIAIWEGHKYTKEEAQAASGIENIFYIEDFDAALEKIMLLAEKVYLNLNENDRAVNDVPYKDIRFAKDLKERFPLHDYGRANPILAKLRTIKSELEIETIQSACNITEKAFRRVLGFIKPNVYEYEIEAEIIHEFITNRSNGHAYEPIIASGANACCLHYGENNDICKDGEMILMDFGADYANYASDLTRTIPVNGIFSERQKEVYNANLKVMKEASSMLRPGITLDDFNKEVGKVMESALIDIKLLDATDVKNQNPHSPLYRKYFMHGTSHFMGLDVHDIGNRYEPIKEGMVFTCEPGIYIREEGLGIRLENDLFIGANENTDLMANIPIEIEEIESLMNK